MKILIQIFLVLLFIGCQSKEVKNYESKILGKWIFAEEYFITRYNDEGFEEPPPPPRERLGYNFFSKDSCETNFSFFKINDTTKINFRGHYSDIANLGRKTAYKIENDSLKIFNRSFNRWESFYIMNLDSNNMVLNNHNTIIQKFARVIKK
ncbi:lipocalin family protein [Chryseobacterium foetidum]|uniref:lipocalin family protein n=1 Tax=Chryseobacterium foetidum TaxID=2951057 RepID=UPI0021C5A219|nr:lipocalin family protein [Chryseobacterium foetidum]